MILKIRQSSIFRPPCDLPLLWNNHVGRSSYKTAEAFSYIGEIRDGREPLFRVGTMVLTSFQGKTGMGTQPRTSCLSDRLSSLDGAPLDVKKEELKRHRMRRAL